MNSEQLENFILNSQTLPRELPQGTQFSVKVYKQYFNFASSHFLIFNDGSREPLHGHNYRVQVEGQANELHNDMVFDFLDLKPMVRLACDELDHKLLLPSKNPYLNIRSLNSSWELTMKNEDYMVIPKQDCLILPIENTSAERIAIYLAYRIQELVLNKFNFHFPNLKVEVEETPGQSAVYTLTQKK